MSIEIIEMIDRAIATLTEARKPVSDALSAIEAELFSLRKARMVLRPDEKPHANGAAVPPLAATPQARDGLPEPEGLEERILFLIGAEEIVASATLIDRFLAHYPRGNRNSINSKLNNLANAGRLERVRRGYFSKPRPRQPPEPESTDAPILDDVTSRP